MNNSLAHIQVYLERFERCLHAYIKTADIPAARMVNAIEYALFPGGKRIRPQLVYLSGELLGLSDSALDAMAIAVELIHAYSLVHDDLPAMDDDDMRRGKPSCHKAFDEATAILVGDALQALAVDVLLRELPQVLPLPKVIAITHELFKACGPAGMISGQSLDITELSKPHVSEEVIAQVHDLKTGRLMLACINMTLAASDAPPKVAHALRLFAAHLGFVFQMQDDYLDAYSPTDVLGKAGASDQANQKTTFATCYSEKALEKTIQAHFEKTEKALARFGERANALKALLSQVLARSNLPAL